MSKWIEAESGLEYRCSECGEYVDKITIMGKPYLYNYCPNCGVRMKEDFDSINSCYKCAHAGTAPYDKPCSVCARNHVDHFEKREDPNAFDGK